MTGAERSAPRMKARIIGVGLAWPHEPDELGRIWTADGWAVEGGDFPGWDVATGTVGGWTMAELALLSELARVGDYGEALRFAERLRPVPGQGAPLG